MIPEEGLEQAEERMSSGTDTILGSMTEVHAAGAPTIPAPTQRKGARFFIMVTVALDMFAMGLIAPVLPQLIEQFVGGSEALTSRMVGLFATVFACMQFFFSPVLGSLSDRYGRRPIVLLSNLGMGMDYVVMALAPNFHWLFLGRVISGITAASIPTALAYTADVTPREQRAAAFGAISAAFGVGFVLGPALGGLLGSYGPRLPFWAAGVLSLLNAMYGFFILPESLPKSLRSPFSWKRANPVGSLKLIQARKALVPLSCILLLSYLSQQSFNTWVVYTQYRYHWSSGTIGLSLSLLGIGSGIVGSLLVKPAVSRLGETSAMIASLAVGAVGFSLFGFSAGGILFWFGIPIMNAWGVCGPAAQSLMSQHVNSSEQGQLQGAVTSIRGLTGLIGPMMFTGIFSLSISKNTWFPVPGSPFFLASVLLLCAMVIALWLKRQPGEPSVASS